MKKLLGIIIKVNGFPQNSRIHGHKLRSSQAILIKTIIKDDPRLTIRLKNRTEKHIPIIIIDKDLKIPINSKLLRYIKKKSHIFTSKKIKNQKI